MAEHELAPPPPAPPAVQRLVALRLEEARNNPPPPLDLRPNENWTYSNAATVRLLHGGSVQLTAGPGAPEMLSDLEFDAGQYNEIAVCMKAERGDALTVRWRGDFVPAFGKEASIDVPLVRDGAFHTYTIRFNHLSAPDWSGRITSLALFLSDVPSGVTIESVQIRAVPPEGPTRVTLLEETREALLGSQPPWTLTLPDHSAFEAWVGLRAEGPRSNKSQTTQFQVVLTPETGEAVTLSDTLLSVSDTGDNPGWKRIGADLSAYAGQTVQIELIAGIDADRPWAQPYWGSPLVYGRAERDTTPVILISLDTTRADHFSCYGYERETTPVLDQFARDAVVFENAYAEEPWTLPSHLTMMTGLHPRNHGTTPSANLRESRTTLAETLGENGYLAAGFTGAGGWLASWRGAGHGFDRYSVPPEGVIVRPAKKSFALASDWVHRHAQTDFFLFVHSMDMHVRPASDRPAYPYGPQDRAWRYFSRDPGVPESLAGKTRGLFSNRLFAQVNRGAIVLNPEEHGFYVSLYDDTLRYVDAAIGNLFNLLLERDIYNSALIIVTADHGEGLFDHGVYGHSNVLQENARVPLLIKFPYGEFGGTRYPGLVELADLFPTVLDVLEIPASEVDGTSLLVQLRGAEGTPSVYLQRYQQEAVLTRGWKYIRRYDNGATHLYDLESDPSELLNVAAERPDVAAKLEKQRQAFFDTARPGWHIALANGADAVPAQVSVQTDAGFRQVWRKQQDRDNDRWFFPDSERRFTIAAPCAPGKWEQLTLIPEHPDQAITISVQSRSPLRLSIGDAPPELAEAGRLSVSPSDATGAPPTRVEANKDELRIAIHYVPLEGEFDPRPLSESDRQALEALGYL